MCRTALGHAKTTVAEGILLGGHPASNDIGPRSKVPSSRTFWCLLVEACISAEPQRVKVALVSIDRQVGYAISKYD